MKLRITALVVFGATSVALANSGTQLPFAQYQAGTESTSSALVTNGNFELPGAPNPNTNPTGWTLDNQMQVATPINPPSPASTVGNFAAQGGGQPTPANPNRFTQIVTLASNTDYVLSAYLWNFGVDFDLSIAELVDPNDELNTVTLAQSRHTDNFDDASTGTFVYMAFNSSQFSTLNPRLDVEFDFDENLGDLRPAIVAQIDNVSITPAGQFSPPSLIPEPTSLVGLCSIGLVALSRRRSRAR